MNWWDIVSMVSNIVMMAATIAAVYVALKVSHDASLPQPVAYLEHDRDKVCIRLVIKNFGSGVATDMEVEDFSYRIVSDRFRSHAEKSFIANGIPLLVPGAQRDTTILAGSADMESHKDQQGLIVLTYKERSLFGRARERKVSFVLDVASFSGSLYSNSNSYIAANSLKRTAECAKKILSQQERIAESLNDLVEASAGPDRAKR